MSKKLSLEDILSNFQIEKNSSSNVLQEIEFEKKRNSRKKSSSSIDSLVDDEYSEDSDNTHLTIPAKRVRKPIYNDTIRKISFIPNASEKSDQEKSRILEIISKSFLFSGLEYKKLLEIIDSMNIKKFEAQQKVLSRGDESHELYILDSGKVAFESDSKSIQEFGPESIFGEISLLYPHTLDFSLITLEKSVFLTLDRDNFTNIVKNSVMENRKKFKNLLAKVFSQSSSEELERLIDGCKFEIFCTGEFIVRKGNDTGKLFVIYEGKADSPEQENIEFVWENNLNYSVIADSTVKCLTFSKECLKRIMDY